MGLEGISLFCVVFLRLGQEETTAIYWKMGNVTPTPLELLNLVQSILSSILATLNLMGSVPTTPDLNTSAKASRYK